MAKKPTVIVPKLVDESLANDKLTALKNLFPEVMTEVKDDDGKIVYGIDVEKLAEAVSGKAVEKFETYGLNWIGKSQCIALSKEAPAGALRPCVEDSVNFNETENVYIEGDNLEVLKLLRSTYKGKIKMIYIDPPYNTGNDFIYKDNFKMPIEQYKLITGQKDEDGNKLTTEKETAGYRHSDWLNMMYPRLKIARELLTDDGVIFISIDDNEIANLKKICDEIFGGGNFVAQFIWRGGRRNAAKFVSTSHEYMLCYAKNLSYCNVHNISWREKKKGLAEIYKQADDFCKRTNNNYNEASQLLRNWYRNLSDDNDSKVHSHYSMIDQYGVYFPSDISRGGGGGPKWNDIKNPETGNFVAVPARGWAYSNKDDLINDIQNGLIHFNGDGVPCKKIYLRDNETQLKETVFYKDRRGSSQRLRLLFGENIFAFPKDENILHDFIASFTTNEDIVLDFFSGSATTAHAVMQLNAEDGGNRKYIMVQLPAETPEKSEARKAGYNTICEIGKERIRRAGKRIKEEYPDKNIDTGFRVYKLDSSNINEEIFKKPHETSVYKLIADKIKEDRTDLDLLTQVMLENSIELSVSIKVEQIDGHKVYSVDNDYLIACFDTDIKEETFKKLLQKENVALIALKEPINDSFLTNVNVLKMQYNPDMEVRVLEYGI